MNEFDIFISYSRKDFDEVEALKKRIEEQIQDVRCWLDLDGIESGEEFTTKIVSAIEQSKILLFAVSDNSMASTWTQKEVRYASNKGIRIIPVLLKNAKLSGWFLFEFGNLDCISIDNPLQFNKMLRNISEILGRTLNSPTPPLIRYFTYPQNADRHEGSTFPLSWEVCNCTKVELKIGGRRPKEVAAKGEELFTVRASRCTIVLTAYNGTSKCEEKITITKEKGVMGKISSWLYKKTKKILK
jgi:hypothetical protein